MEKEDLKRMARYIVDEMDSRHNADLAFKWSKGTVVFQPGDPNTNEHEISMEKFMHKVVLVRDNLRVLEQNINSSSSLSEAEKLKFQSYITKCYGSLTSFNFMFYSDEDKFKSKR